MTLRTGELRKRVLLQRRNSAQDAYGQQVTTWTTILDTWAKIETLTGGQLDRARSIYNHSSHQVVMRWRALLDDVRQVGSYRVLYGMRIFDVGASMDMDERNKEVTLLCSEGLNEGS